MKLRLKANNPLVVKAARERSRILTELGRTVDPKTARIAKLTPVEPTEKIVRDLLEVDPESLRVPIKGVFFEGVPLSKPGESAPVVIEIVGGDPRVAESFDVWTKKSSGIEGHAGRHTGVRPD